MFDLEKTKKEMESIAIVDNVKLNDDETKIIILNQVLLPNIIEYKEINNLEDAYQAIKKLEIRGAPAIGIFAGYAMYILSLKDKDLDFENFYKNFKANKEYLNSSRPTAVNLSWALNRMDKVALDNKDKSVNDIISLLKDEAKKIHNEDIEMCLKISEYGLSLLKDGDGVLTHCNAGPIATSYGTAQGPLLLSKARGMHIKVFADETRPLLQGARLTSFFITIEAILSQISVTSTPAFCNSNDVSLAP